MQNHIHCLDNPLALLKLSLKLEVQLYILLKGLEVFKSILDFVHVLRLRSFKELFDGYPCLFGEYVASHDDPYIPIIGKGLYSFPSHNRNSPSGEGWGCRAPCGAMNKGAGQMIPEGNRFEASGGRKGLLRRGGRKSECKV